MQLKNIDELFAPFAGSTAICAAFAARLAALGVDPAEVGALHDEYMAERMRDMVPAPAPTNRGDTRRAAGQPDTEFRLGPCPSCGADAWGIQKCPHISPPWRVFLACDNEACGYHGRSRLTVAELRRRWPEGVEVD